MPKQTIEEQLSTAQTCREFDPDDPWLALCVRHLKHIVELKAQLAPLDWRPFTADTVWELHTEIGMWLLNWPPKPAFWHFVEWPEGTPEGQYWIDKGYTHYRRENPPAPRPA
jgi:hypothetical protein